MNGPKATSNRRMLTAEQDAAINGRQPSIGLSAGAGCGKTFVLTERFLTHLQRSDGVQDSSCDPLSRVVAITFTDRAAREMRDRIRSGCRARLQLCPESEAGYWLEILRRIDTARISTIHSFCAGFLRRHAVAAGVDPQFGLLEADTGGALLRSSVKRTVRRLLEQQNADCVELTVAYGLAGVQRFVRQLLARSATIDIERFAEYDAERFRSVWLEYRDRTFIPRLMADLGRSDAVVETIALLEQNEPSNAVMRERRETLLPLLAALGKQPAPDIEVLRDIREVAFVQGGGSQNAWATEDVYEAVRDALSRLRDEIDDAVELTGVDCAVVAQDAQRSVAAVRVLQAAKADFAAAKHEAELLDFDDLLVHTRDLLRRSEATRKEAQAGIALLLVDEFQDTDPVQSEIVRLLIGRSEKGTRLFVVGDAKQSIYRFRGADPTVFDALRQSIPRDGRLPLSTNFRSQPEVLNFVNAVFEPALKEKYERLRPNRKQICPTPCIEFLFAVPQPDDDPDLVEDRRRREAGWIARRIRELLNDPTPRVAERDSATGDEILRPVRAGDVAVLFRALSDVAIYEDVFRRLGIDYYLVGGRAFFAQQEVYDLINLCTWLNDPDDAISLIGILRSPFFSLDDDTIFALAGAGWLREPLAGLVPSVITEQQRECVHRAAAVLSELLSKKDRIPLAALLQLAIERTGYDASLLHEFLGRRKVANLQKLVDMAREFESSGLVSLPDFVERLRDSVAEETVEELAATHPETSDVVRLMTVHQAKGLEFPVVIVADMDRPGAGIPWEAVSHRDFGPLLPPPPFGDEKRSHIAIAMHRYLERQEDDEESLRILYVAMTRAADLLILSAGLPAAGRVRSRWLRILAERFDLTTGLPKGDPHFGASSMGTASRDSIPEIRVHNKPPALSVVVRGRQPRAGLAQFREIVEQGEPAPLPPLVQPVSPSRSSRPRYSVSQIEQVDAVLHKPAGQKLLFAPNQTVEERDVESAGLLGTIVHKVLERLDETTADHVDALIKAALREVSLVDSQHVPVELVRGRIQAYLRCELWAELRAAERSFREIDFLLAWPPNATVSDGAVISGTIDCLMQTRSGSWKIIDYKTGRIPAADPAALIEHFGIQMVLYAQAVSSLIGRLPDGIELVAVHEDVHRFPLKLWKEFIAPVTHRVDAAIHFLADFQADPNRA